MECPRCLLTDDIQGVVIGEKQCNYCDLHDKLDSSYPISKELELSMIDRIKHRGKKHKYDCLIGISGGSDSSYLLYWAKQNGLRVLAFHFDNGFNKDLAERNMTRMIEYTGFDLIRIRVNSIEYNDLNKAFLLASVSDCDIPNDIAMGSLMLDLALKYDVKTIINGHSFRTEGSTPIGWTYMDGAYLNDVYQKYIDKKLENYPNFPIWQQIKASIKGIHHERPFYHIKHSKKEVINFLESHFGWESYKGRHCENKYTEFAGWVGYRKFGIDKRIVELSANIRDNVIDKYSAKLILNEKPKEPESIYEILDKIGLDKSGIWESILKRPRKMFYEFNTYQAKFIKCKWLIWIGYKFGFLPKTFFEKYTKRIRK